MKNGKQEALVMAMGKKKPMDDDEDPKEMITTNDPSDGHVHDIPHFAIDDEGNGSTAPGGDPMHVHAIVDHEIMDAVHGKYRSSHEIFGFKEEGNEQKESE